MNNVNLIYRSETAATQVLNSASGASVATAVVYAGDPPLAITASFWQRGAVAGELFAWGAADGLALTYDASGVIHIAVGALNFAAAAPLDAEWHHIALGVRYSAGGRQRGEIRLWKDGVLVFQKQCAVAGAAPVSGADLRLGLALAGTAGASLAEFQLQPACVDDARVITELERRALPAENSLLHLKLDGSDPASVIVGAPLVDAPENDPPEGDATPVFADLGLRLRSSAQLDLSWTADPQQSRLQLFCDERCLVETFPLTPSDSQFSVDCTTLADGLDLLIHRDYTAIVQSGSEADGWTTLATSLAPAHPLNLQTPAPAFQYPLSDAAASDSGDAPSNSSDPSDPADPSSSAADETPTPQLLAQWYGMDQAESYAATLTTSVGGEAPTTTTSELAPELSADQWQVDLTTQLNDAADEQSFALVVRGLTPSCATRGPGSDAVALTSPAPQPVFIIENPEEAPTTRLALKYAAVDGAVMYYVTVSKTKNADGSPVETPAPSAYMLGKAYPEEPYVFEALEIEAGCEYQTSLRALGAGYIAAWSRATIIAEELAAPVLRFDVSAWSAGADLPVLWDDVRTADQIQRELVVSYEAELWGWTAAGDAQRIAPPPESTDEPTYLQNDAESRRYTIAYQYLPAASDPARTGVRVRTRTDSAVGPWSATPELAAPAPNTLSYDAESQILEFDSGTSANAEYYYQNVSRETGATLSETIIAADADRTVRVSQLASGGETYTGVTRALAGGALSLAAETECFILPRPYLEPLTADFDAGSIRADWLCTIPATPALTFSVELYMSAVVSGEPLLSESGIAAVYLQDNYSWTFTDARLVRGETYTVRVRAVKADDDSTVGAWSNVESVGGMPQVRALSVRVVNNQARSLAASWAPVAVDGVVYELEADEGALSITPSESASASAELIAGGTDVNEPHLLRVRARKVGDGGGYKNGDTGPWSDPAQFEFVKQDDDDEEDEDQQEKPNDQHEAPQIAEPINVAMGTYSYARTLLQVRGVATLSFNIYYNSFGSTTIDAGLGARWNHAYGTRLVRYEATDPVSGLVTRYASIYSGDGGVATYIAPDSGYGPFTSTSGPSAAMLTYTVSGGTGVYTLTDPDGATSLFDSAGRLTLLVSAQGVQVALSYSDTSFQLSRVTDATTGRYFAFDYSGANLVCVYDNAGNAVALASQAGGQFARVSVPFVLTGANRASQCQQVLASDSQTIKFYYWSAQPAAFLLERIVDQANRDYLYNEYAPDTSATAQLNGGWRVTYQEDARARALPENQRYGFRLSYSSGPVFCNVATVESTVVDRSGFTSIFRCSPANGRVLAAVYALESGAITSSTHIKRVTRFYDAFYNLTREWIYEGAAGDDPFTNGLGDLDPTPTPGAREIEIVYGRDSAGRLTYVEYPRELNVGLRDAAKNWQGRVADYVYDASGRLIRAMDDAGNVTQYVYDGAVLRATIDALGGARNYEYLTDQDANAAPGLVWRITESYGGAARYNAQIFSYYTASDPAPNRPGDLKSITNAACDVSEYVWNANGQLNILREKDSTGAVLRESTLEYNAEGLLHTVTLRAHGQTPEQAAVYRCDYDYCGNLRAWTNPLQQTANLYYNENNRMSRIDYPSGGAIDMQRVFQYDLDDRLNLVDYGADADGARITQQFGFDGLGRLTFAIDGRGQQTNLQRGLQPYQPGLGAHAQSLVIVDPPKIPPPATPGVPAVHAMYTLSYDALGRVQGREDRTGRSSQIAYGRAADPEHSGAFVRIVSMLLPPIDPTRPDDRFSLTTNYDALGRVLSFQNAGGGVTSLEYANPVDANGVALDPTAALEPGAPIPLAYRSLIITQPDDATAIYVVDPLGRLSAELPGESHAQPLRRDYRYDALGRLTRVDETGVFDLSAGAPATRTTTYAYETADDGNLRISIRGPDWTPPAADAPAQSFDFDALGRLIRRIDADNHTRSYAYTPQGLHAQLVNARGQTLDYAYDDAGRYVGLSHASAEGAADAAFIHTLNGNGDRVRSIAQDASGKTLATIDRAFNQLGQLLSRTYAKDGVSRTVSYAYSPSGDETLTYPDGVTQVRYARDGLGRLASVTDWNGVQHSYSYTPTGRVLQARFQSATVGPHAVAQYAYDSACRLKLLRNFTADEGILSEENYQWGNAPGVVQGRIILPLSAQPIPGAHVMPADDDNRILARDDVQIGSDADGNAAATASGVAPIYDALGRVTQLGDQLAFNYDADGLRVRMQTDEPCELVYEARDFSSPLLEPAGSAPPYSYARGVLAPQILAEIPSTGGLDRALELYDGSGKLVSRFVHGAGLLSRERYGDTVEQDYYRFDSRGSALALCDENGAVRAAYAYDLYGRAVAVSGDDAGNFFRFNGRDGTQDDGAALYMRARHMDPGLARFLQKDFILGDVYRPGSLNAYAYAGGDPLTRVDPLGLSFDIAIPAIAAGGLGPWVVGGAGVVAVIAGGIIAGAVIAGLWGSDHHDNDDPAAPPSGGAGGVSTPGWGGGAGSPGGVGVSSAPGGPLSPGVGVPTLPGQPGLPSFGEPGDLSGAPGLPGLPTPAAPRPNATGLLFTLGALSGPVAGWETFEPLRSLARVTPSDCSLPSGGRRQAPEQLLSELKRGGPAL